jgi:Transposase DDE domain group 1
MSIQPAVQGTFSFFHELPIVIETTGAQLTSDAGLLPIREFDERIGLTHAFAAVLHDRRDAQLLFHSFLQMTRSRVYGILADYVDQNDHDTLRSDPVFKLIADRSPADRDLASQPTLSRFENAISIASLKRLRDAVIDQFIASFLVPPRHLTFDLDAVDDPAHGAQQLVLFHGYFEQYQYFPSFITCADNDQVVVLSLRPGAVHAALGADDDLEYLVGRLRRAWPGVHIAVRGDAGYGMPWMYAVCEHLGIDYIFGISANAVLKRESDTLLEQAVATYTQTKTPQRLFHAFWYQAGSWDHARWVIVKAEANAQGTNRRFIVTNRPGALVVPEAAYDDYAQRGESENRNKELKCGLAIDRTSDHRFMANFFRLYLHAAAFNLLARFRQAMALPALPVGPEPVPAEAGPDTPPPLLPLPPTPVPEALTGAARRRHLQKRRNHDRLAEAQPCTWRSLLIKVAAEVHVSTRRIVVRLSAHWPNLPYFQRVCQRLAATISNPLPSTG